MEENIVTTTQEIENLPKQENEYKTGAIVLIGTILGIVLLKFLSNLAMKQKSKT